jgi:hypothetical protein
MSSNFLASVNLLILVIAISSSLASWCGIPFKVHVPPIASNANVDQKIPFVILEFESSCHLLVYSIYSLKKAKRKNILSSGAITLQIYKND